ncbi:hypothetical protein [Undibacterium sp.]|uniref:hypothetical protein n=1 Tax=Undibacterium sp. TaxID=1914977 RepID=UPI0025F1DC5F|nr:hypothetical protein [Undibacterium sp.]MCX7220544.1 hypothetical protein [Burkholderiales bacterium]
MLRKFLLTLCTLMSLVALTNCGGDSGYGSSPAPANGGSGTTAPPTPEPPPADKLTIIGSGS